MYAAAAAVAYIEVTRHEHGVDGATEGGTAFLVDAQHVMTAYHVVEQRDVPNEGHANAADVATQVAGARLAFDYTTTRNRATFVELDELIAHDPDLDYALLRLKQPVAATPLPFFVGQLRDPDEGFTFVANIIQHPEKQAKQLGLRNNAVWKLDPQHMYYFTDTRGGTSGAPVFDDDWRVIAMHTGWEPFESAEAVYMGRKLGFANRGTLARGLVTSIGPTLPGLTKIG
jgi:endonuclease G, mitochondrial